MVFSAGEDALQGPADGMIAAKDKVTMTAFGDGGAPSMRGTAGDGRGAKAADPPPPQGRAEAAAPIGPAAAALPLPRAREALAERNGEALRTGAAGVPARVGVPLAGVIPLDWLAAQTATPGLCRRDRQGTRRIAAVGSADSLTCDAAQALPGLVERPGERLRQAQAGLCWFAGLRFDRRAPIAPEWRAFGLARPGLPRFAVTVEGGRRAVRARFPAGAGARRGPAPEGGARSAGPSACGADDRGSPISA